jgi:hypothetical protein
MGTGHVRGRPMSWHKDDYALRQIVEELFATDRYTLTWEYDYPELKILIDSDGDKL